MVSGDCLFLVSILAPSMNSLLYLGLIVVTSLGTSLLSDEGRHGRSRNFVKGNQNFSSLLGLLAPSRKHLIELPCVFPFIVKNDNGLDRLAPAGESALRHPLVYLLYHLLRYSHLHLCGCHIRKQRCLRTFKHFSDRRTESNLCAEGSEY